MTHPQPIIDPDRPTECAHRTEYAPGCPYRNVVTINDRTAFCCTAGDRPAQLRWRRAIRGDRTAACLKAYPVEAQS